MADVIPWLRYDDATGAVEWLCRAFGMREHFVVHDESGGIAHAQLTLGDGMIMVGSARDDGLNVRTPAEAGCVTQGIYAVVDDIDAAYVLARGAGAEIVNELVKTAHGSTDFAVRDIGGHLWNFGTYRPESVADGAGDSISGCPSD